MHRGHNSQTAVWLGVSRRALYDKMRDYGLDGEASAMRTEAGIMGPRKVELDGDSDLLRRRSLVDYLGSLDRFEALDPQVVLPGHGPAFTSVGALVTATRAHHERRAEEIHAHISRLVEPTAYELSRAVFPHIDGFEILLAISEVLGHVDLLVADGDVVIDLGSPTRYAST